MLTTTTAVRERIGLAEADDDVLLRRMITNVSSLFDRHCNRLFARVESDSYEFPAMQRTVIAPRFPVEWVGIVQVRDNTRSAWRTASVLCRSGAGGVITLNVAPGTEEQTARVLYTGGYVLPGTTAEEGQTALPGDVEEAAIQQTVFLYQNRFATRVADVTGRSAAKGDGDLTLLPSVIELLAPYRRHIML